jgi:hypothetical protein
LYQPGGGYNSDFAKSAMTRAEQGAPRGDAKHEAQPIAFARTHYCAAAAHFRVRVEATSMAEAEQQSTTGEQRTIVARGARLA